MPVDEKAEKLAKAELLEIKEEWDKINNTIRDFQISPKEGLHYSHQLWQVKDGFKYRYSQFISIELYREALGSFERIRTDLDLALRKGHENYEMGKHKRWVDWANALGLGVIIGIIISTIIFLVCKLVLNIEIPLC
jgi:hypothetical protein